MNDSNEKNSGEIWAKKYWNDKLGIEESLQQEINAEAAAREEYLNSTSLRHLTFDPQQVAEAARNDLNFLAPLAIPTVFQFDFSPALLAIWDLLINLFQGIEKAPKLALGIPRGHAKTTLLKLYVLYLVLFTDIKFILIVGSTEQRATDFIADVISMLYEKNIVATFGDWKLGAETDTKTMKKFGFRGRNIVIAGLGQGGSVRGINVNNMRPEVMIFDDVQTKEDSESDLISDKLLTWLVGTVMKARDPRRCMYIYVGNMYPGTNCILRKLKDNPQWISFTPGAILADGTALFPALRSVESLIEELNNDIAIGKPEVFFSEVMNDTEVGVNSSTDLARIKPWPWGEHEQPQGKFIIIDPSNDKKKSDEVAIGYFEVYDATPGLRKVIEEKLSPGNTIRRALLLGMQTGTRLIAVESTAYQYSLLYWFGQICEQLGLTGFKFVDVYSGSYSKNSRISDVNKKLTQGELNLHEEVRSRVLHQIVNWNPMKRDNTDNILDLLSYADKVVELYGNEIVTHSQHLINEAGFTEENVPMFNSAF